MAEFDFDFMFEVNNERVKTGVASYELEDGSDAVSRM
jgi:hypothetical protein